MSAFKPGTPPHVPLWAPYYGAPFSEAVARYWQKYARFDGRASRSEYWWWALADTLVILVLGATALLGGVVGSRVDTDGSFTPGAGIVVGVVLLLSWWFVTLIPGLAVGARRLHDADLSGLLLLLLLIPNLGGLAILVMTLLPPHPRGARFDHPDRQLPETTTIRPGAGAPPASSGWAPPPNATPEPAVPPPAPRGQAPSTTKR